MRSSGVRIPYWVPAVIFTGLRNGFSYIVTVSATKANGPGLQPAKSNTVIPRYKSRFDLLTPGFSVTGYL